MSETESLDDLVLDLLEWIGPGSQPYAEVLEVWRTSCPRLAVWEEAHRRGFLTRIQRGGVVMVEMSETGAEHLNTHRRRAAAVS